MDDHNKLDKILRFFFFDLVEKHRENRRHTRLLAVDHLLDWARCFLPHHFSEAPSKMHLWLADRLDEARTRRGTKLNVLAPRGAAKSTVATLAYPLRELLERREPYIWLVSDTMSQAYAHLENIKCELLENGKIANRYPNCVGKGPVWRNGAVILRNGAAIEAYGTGQRLRGRRRREHRPTLILCDDLQNDNHIVSGAARERSRSWFHGTLLKAGTEKTNVVNLATALHREAIALELLEKPGWISRVFKAIERWPRNRTLWEEWETIYANVENTHAAEEAMRFYEKNRNKMNEEAELLWPEHETLYTLMKMRAESGRTAFEREKQNSPVDPDHCEFPESYFDETIWFEHWPADLRLKAMALDPSKGGNAAVGDYSAFIIVALDSKGLFYIDADLARRPVPEIVADGVELYKKHRPDVFGIEINQFQELLKDDFETAFAAEAMPQVALWPIRNTTNKKVRIRRLGPLLSSKRLKFRYQSPSVRLLIDQLKSFPVGDHDDGPDALEMAVRMLEEWTRETTASEHRLHDRFLVTTK